MNLRYELIDNNNPTWKGQRFTDLTRAQKALAEAVGNEGRWSLKDRLTKTIIGWK